MNRLGKTPSEDAGTRDAHHVACVVVTCESALMPGMNIRFVENSTTKVEFCMEADRHGIADPFVYRGRVIPAGEKVWILIDPEHITEGVTHHFKIKRVDDKSLPIKNRSPVHLHTEQPLPSAVPVTQPIEDDEPTEESDDDWDSHASWCNREHC